MSLPKSHPVDRYLWLAVASRLGYFELIVLSTFLFPVLLGMLLPPTAIGITGYVVSIVTLCAFAAMVQDSRDRWLAFRAAIGRDEGECRVPVGIAAEPEPEDN